MRDRNKQKEIGVLAPNKTMIKKFHFRANVRGQLRTYILVDSTRPTPEVVMTWPMSGYSREKALKRADRYVGEQVRQADAGTQFTYTQDTPVI